MRSELRPHPSSRGESRPAVKPGVSTAEGAHCRDAAFRAIDRLNELKVCAKSPKRFRHRQAKTALPTSPICSRLSGCDCVTCCGRHLPVVDLATDSREVIRRSVARAVNPSTSTPTCCGCSFRAARQSSPEVTVRTSTKAGDHAGHDRDVQRAARDGAESSRVELAAFAAFDRPHRQPSWASNRQPAPHAASSSWRI